jgi:fermentation-respiration switch protein FrsA (DUF1100 family)
VVMLFENRFIYFPAKYPVGQYAQAASIPDMKDCWMTTEDGVKLHGWFLPADSAVATLMLLHGNAGNISSRNMLMVTLRKYGFNVFMFDYRGYGKSDGEPSENGIYIDGTTAFDYVAKLPQVDSQKIVLWGTSLGGAVAVDVATKRHAAGLILESTFTSAADIAAEHYSFIVRYFLRTKLNSVGKIAQIHTPLFVMHGSMDRTVPFRFGKELYDAAHEPKEFYEITGAGHNNTFMTGGVAYIQHVREFVLKHVLQKH